MNDGCGIIVANGRSNGLKTDMSDKSNWGPGAHLSPDEWESAINDAESLLMPVMDARDAENLRLSKEGWNRLRILADTCLYLLGYDNSIGRRDDKPTLLHSGRGHFRRPGTPLAISDVAIEKGGTVRQ